MNNITDLLTTTAKTITIEPTTYKMHPESDFHAWIYDTKEDKIIDDNASNFYMCRRILNHYDMDTIQEHIEALVYREHTGKYNERINRYIRNKKMGLNDAIKEYGKKSKGFILENTLRHKIGVIGYCLTRALCIWKSNPRRYKLKIGSIGVKPKGSEDIKWFFEAF